MSRGVVFSYSFSIYCAAYHGIWCSVLIIVIVFEYKQFLLNLRTIFFINIFDNKGLILLFRISVPRHYCVGYLISPRTF